MVLKFNDEIMHSKEKTKITARPFGSSQEIQGHPFFGVKIQILQKWDLAVSALEGPKWFEILYFLTILRGDAQMSGQNFGHFFSPKPPISWNYRREHFREQQYRGHIESKIIVFTFLSPSKKRMQWESPKQGICSAYITKFSNEIAKHHLARKKATTKKKHMFFGETPKESFLRPHTPIGLIPFLLKPFLDPAVFFVFGSPKPKPLHRIGSDFNSNLEGVVKGSFDEKSRLNSTKRVETTRKKTPGKNHQLWDASNCFVSPYCWWFRNLAPPGMYKTL